MSTNDRGHYGRRRSACSRVGSQFQQISELSQRYEGVHTAAVQAILNALSAEGGRVASTGSSRWEVALKDGPWVRLDWDPNFRVLRVTITDKQLRPVDQAVALQGYFEQILLQKITPRLLGFGAVVVGVA